MLKCPECNGTQFETVPLVPKLLLVTHTKAGGKSKNLASVKIRMCKNCRFLKLYAR